jgi:hypothetical protein
MRKEHSYTSTEIDLGSTEGGEAETQQVLTSDGRDFTSSAVGGDGIDRELE